MWKVELGGIGEELKSENKSTFWSDFWKQHWQGKPGEAGHTAEVVERTSSVCEVLSPMTVVTPNSGVLGGVTPIPGHRKAEVSEWENQHTRLQLLPKFWFLGERWEVVPGYFYAIKIK